MACITSLQLAKYGGCFERIQTNLGLSTMIGHFFHRLIVLVLFLKNRHFFEIITIQRRTMSVNFIWHLNRQTFIHMNILNILGLTPIQINRNVYLSKVAKLHNTTLSVILCTYAIFICNDLLGNNHIILYIL